ncbi:hypothetical protein [Paraburkholderia kururiensis]|uniref:Uncharacterized protein n=1 Tax=Paraburkholderia kururiensis TaxID=984307 RepID=A0ABZ0WLG9_9BURK|nr:hypothetical protein [Paraburkholderia kururiensis]WQD78207.1 hypothetical protein U0042_00370 [Paraburkholderia kururiensis]
MKRVHGESRAFARIVAAEPARGTDSVFRALQGTTLSRLASNGDEHAPVRTVAILGYN